MDEFTSFFHNAPPAVDVEGIHKQWLALGTSYDVNNWFIPLPPWAARPYDDSGERAWRILADDLTQASEKKPFCIYIHVPFCGSKCRFCDCYSFKLASHVHNNIDAYLDRLEQELILWSERGNLSRRPVSTVHFGGGTPSFLDTHSLRRLCETIAARFTITDQTEWALESTVAGMTPDMYTMLHDIGFRRLHIGVQSMESPVRAMIGRQCPADMALDCVDQGRRLGWIVSVDLICGLPQQTLPGFVDGIDQLLEHGVNGFSFYELLIYPQNIRWAVSIGLHPRSHLPNYLYFHTGAQLLESHGYRRNLFNHWVDELDDNRYFTFPARGEDCLAVGTIADGVFGDYHFRHPQYAAYLKTARGDMPALEGGLRRTARESAMRPLATAILSGTIADDLWANPYLADSDSQRLQDKWAEAMLVERKQPGQLTLTANGGWFAGNMIRELTGIYPRYTFQR